MPILCRLRDITPYLPKVLKSSHPTCKLARQSPLFVGRPPSNVCHVYIQWLTILFYISDFPLHCGTARLVVLRFCRKWSIFCFPMCFRGIFGKPYSKASFAASAPPEPRHVATFRKCRWATSKIWWRKKIKKKTPARDIMVCAFASVRAGDHNLCSLQWRYIGY